ncbi:hypothetical protein BBF96_01640 [Anoxybacter fermentans]|uniref:t-SNARE coiled-coil homology domain-containing protein n=1 Tax=Anoxybacter fermentans TaxID=1323375 RepID=A0A3Q9HNX9_9FIRM|nr:hypothetical protein [Anoxybacter fermentans]AZR72211.1 hypothetical protein BBF96_01640 [Anoxybacter fermentans]
MEKIEKVLHQILENQVKMQSDITRMQSDITKMQSDIAKIQSDITKMQSDITNLKSEVKEIKLDLKTVMEQTAELTEFRTETIRKFDKISNDIDFIKHKELQNEQDIFYLKKNFKSSF